MKWGTPTERAVIQLLQEFGFEYVDGVYRKRRHRVQIRATVKDAVNFVIVNGGIETGISRLRQKLEHEVARLDRDCHRNQFLERRLARELPKAVRRRLEEGGLGGVKVEDVE